MNPSASTPVGDVPPFTLRLLGPFEARLGDEPLRGLHLREGERLLAFLALNAAQPVPYRVLAEHFWPAEAQLNAGAPGGDYPSTRQAVRSLRLALGPEAPRVSGRSKGVVGLDLEGVTFDLAEFDRLAESGAPGDWRAALGWYRGPLLEGWSEPWVEAARVRWRRRYEQVLRRLLEHARAGGAIEEVEACLRRLVRSSPLEQSSARALMRFLLSHDRGAEAAELGESLTEQLARQGRGLEPETETLAAEARRIVETLGTRVAAPRSAPRDGGSAPLAPDPGPAAPAPGRPVEFPPSGGAVAPDSHFYLVRPADTSFQAALLRQDSIVLVKGAGQMGKTSLLARGVNEARKSGSRVVVTDFQALDRAQLQSPETLYEAFAHHFVLQLDLDPAVLETWNTRYGAGLSLELFLRRRVLAAVSEPIVWTMDEVDRLFPIPFSAEVFGLFRSWHNRRSLEPDSSWSRLTLAMAYATEAHLFIKDLNQSPFNVGTRLTLEDFTVAQLAELNWRYGEPLAGPREVERLHALLNGQPFLVRRALDEMVTHRWDLHTLEQRAGRDDGPFADHLRRQLGLLARDAELRALVRGVLRDEGCPDLESFYRLRSAGLIIGDGPHEARPRCELYRTFLSRHLT